MLEEKIDLVRAKRQAKEEEIKQTLLTEFREKAALAFESLFPGRRIRSDAGAPLAPKYRGPLGETWSGRGRMPTWLTHLEATGHNKEEFRIEEESASS